MCRAFHRLGITYKKKHSVQGKNEKKKKQEFIAQIQKINKDDVVYVDKSGVDESFPSEKRGALREEQVYGEIGGKKYEQESFIAEKVGSKSLHLFISKEPVIHRYLIRGLKTY